MRRAGFGFRMAIPHLTVSVDERTRLAMSRLGELVLGKWRLERVIGIGGMAAVFEASHKNGSRVAIKILHPDLASSEEIRERFLTEGYAANRVSHPGAVTVRDEGTTADGAVFLVMDLLRGQTLAERLEDGTELFSVGEVLEIASHLLDVLVHAHDRGIVHRDIKPENVFLTREGRVRLLDFGIARVEASARTHQTQPGSTLGTPAFMPPEQALGRWADLDGRSDLWSLGATMFLLLSGSPVREHGSVTEQLLGAMTRPVQSLGDFTALPRSVVAVVDRALAFDREDRFPDARSMQLAVRAVLDELSTPDSRVTLAPPSLEPMAMSLRTPRPDGRYKRPSIPTVRPVAATETPLPGAGRSESPGALPFFISLGFAVGIGIVVAARLTVHSSPHSAAGLTRVDAVPLTASSALVPIVPAPSASSSTAPSASVRRPPARPAAKPASDPLRRRK
jgi:eukaryotic-like serine/threonine-protein kinase